MSAKADTMRTGRWHWRRSAEEETDIHEGSGGVSWAQRLLKWLITVPQDPEFDIQTSSELKNYQVWNSRTYIFLLGGRLHIVRSKPLCFFTFFIVILVCMLFCIFEASWCWNHISPACMILFLFCWGLTISSLFKASTSDPGVVPKNIHLIETPYQLPPGYKEPVLLPGKDGPEAEVDSFTCVEIKYCKTCRNWRMPRTFHCSYCDQCINIHDHHCVWINNCVGERNYRYFFNFILFSTFLGFYLITVSFYHLYKEKAIKNLTMNQALMRMPMSFFNVVFGLVTVLYPLILVIYHIFLIITQQSTREYLKHKRRTLDGPFSFNSIFLNIMSSLFKVRGYSLVSARGVYSRGDSRFKRF